MQSHLYNKGWSCTQKVCFNTCCSYNVSLTNLLATCDEHKWPHVAWNLTSASALHLPLSNLSEDPDFFSLPLCPMFHHQFLPRHFFACSPFSFPRFCLFCLLNVIILLFLLSSMHPLVSPFYSHEASIHPSSLKRRVCHFPSFRGFWWMHM